MHYDLATLDKATHSKPLVKTLATHILTFTYGKMHCYRQRLVVVYARVEHKELWAIIVILLTSMSYFDSAVLLDERPRPTLHDRVHETGSTDKHATGFA